MLKCTYEDIHNMVQEISYRIKAEYNPEVIVAIGGGGLVPARMLRTQLDIPILVVSTVAYSHGELLDQIVCTQWIYDSLEGKRVLLVDEVDDSGTTLKFCLDKLRNDNLADQVAILSLHRKNKPKHYNIEDTVYFCCNDIEDVWVNYPWDVSKCTNTINMDNMVNMDNMSDASNQTEPVVLDHVKGFLYGMCVGAIGTGLCYIVAPVVRYVTQRL